MESLVELIGLSAAMGLSIYLSLPIVLAKSTSSRSIIVINAAAIGILLFLLADIFADVATHLYANPANPYVANLGYAVLFGGSVAGCFLVLFAIEHGSRRPSFGPRGMALVVAGAIGFQNLTEGLVLGESWASGALSLSTVVFVGFFLQNVTEGFPIASPLVGRGERNLGVLAAIFSLGAVPTILGGVAGFYYTSTPLEVAFSSLAIGAILYSLLPMLRAALRPADSAAGGALQQRLTYVGLLAGFLLGFVVNAI